MPRLPGDGRAVSGGDSAHECRKLVERKADDTATAYACREYGVDDAAAALLVLSYLAQQARRRYGGSEREARLFEQSVYAVAVWGCEHAALDCGVAYHCDTHCDGLAVVDLVRAFFDCMRHGVTEVEQSARVGLALVPFDDAGLDADARPYDVAHRFGVVEECLGGVRFEVFEQFAVAYDGRLDDFGHTCAQLAQRQRAQHAYIRNDEAGLREGADHVLIVVEVDAVLAADACVDLSQERRRYEPEIQPAHIGRGHEARHVGYDAAADAQNECRTVDAELHEAAVDLLDRNQRLARLAVADHYIVEAAHQIGVEPVDVGVGYDDDSATRQYPGQYRFGAADIDLARSFKRYGSVHDHDRFNDGTNIIHIFRNLVGIYSRQFKKPANVSALPAPP